MAVSGTDIVDAAREFMGAPYRWWTGAFSEYRTPGYVDYAPEVYTPGFVIYEGGHCSGFVNVAPAVRSRTDRPHEGVRGLDVSERGRSLCPCHSWRARSLVLRGLEARN